MLKSISILQITLHIMSLVGSIYASTDEVIEKCSITVLSPDMLQSTHDGSLARFGNSDKFSGSMVGNVVYIDQSFYSKGCRPFIGEKPFTSSILLVDRRDCYFSLKVWNGQQAGAAAVLIADDKEEPLVPMNFPGGYNRKVEIPSALIRQSFGLSLKKALADGEQVLIKFDAIERKNKPNNNFVPTSSIPSDPRRGLLNGTNTGSSNDLPKKSTPASNGSHFNSTRS